jgi:CxxC-x17-CxxC domain-containing protein
MEYILNNTILALLEVPGSTLLGVNRMLSDVEWRNEIVEKLQDPVIKAFWTKEFARYTQRYEVEATAAIQNKIGQFTSAPIIRNIIGQQHSTIDMRKIMDSKKIFIINLSKGRVGEESSRLLGALLITKLQLAAMSRVDIPEKERNDFILYIDEFQNFSTDSFATILSEARKYRLSLVLAHQYITQMEENVRDAVFGNVGTMLTFRVGADDAEYLEREFTPEFMVQDLVNLPKQHIFVKLAIDGVTSRPFSAETLPPVPHLNMSFREQIIDFSRINYGTQIKLVEERIAASTQADNNHPVSASTNRVSAPPREPMELYDAECYNCGRQIKVPFKPDPKRPAYCKACLKKIGSKEESNSVSLANTSKDFVPTEKKKRTEPKKEEVVIKEHRPRKEVDFIGLKDILKEVKEKSKQSNHPTKSPEVVVESDNNLKKGKISPGETIVF